ncbi:MAG: hypothetical protein O2779_02420 [Nanoarchaeota archaeon]|nr:hypothetical protein [Nanoarchaeota archaeon]
MSTNHKVVVKFLCGAGQVVSRYHHEKFKAWLDQNNPDISKRISVDYGPALGYSEEECHYNHPTEEQMLHNAQGADYLIFCAGMIERYMGMIDRVRRELISIPGQSKIPILINLRDVWGGEGYKQLVDIIREQYVA